MFSSEVSATRRSCMRRNIAICISNVSIPPEEEGLKQSLAPDVICISRVLERDALVESYCRGIGCKWRSTNRSSFEEGEGSKSSLFRRIDNESGLFPAAILYTAHQAQGINVDLGIVATSVAVIRSPVARLGNYRLIVAKSSRLLRILFGTSLQSRRSCLFWFLLPHWPYYQLLRCMTSGLSLLGSSQGTSWTIFMTDETSPPICSPTTCSRDAVTCGSRLVLPDLKNPVIIGTYGLSASKKIRIYSGEDCLQKKASTGETKSEPLINHVK